MTLPVDAQVVVATTRFADDVAVLTDEAGFRIDAIWPADRPTTALVSGFGVRVRLESADVDRPVRVLLVTDERIAERTLPGGTELAVAPRTTGYVLPPNDPSLVVARSGDRKVGRAGMRYRDLIPDRWGGRFISSHITVPDGGPVPDYVHFHKVRFQMIFVKEGWVRVVYEDQGEPFVMRRGDCVLQPPEIRHRVLESSPGLEVIELSSPAEHETIADWSLPLPNVVDAPDRRWARQRFVRHIAADAPTKAWRFDGWTCRDTGIGDATDGLADVMVATPVGSASTERWRFDVEFQQLVVMRGSVTLDIDGGCELLEAGDAAAIPPDLEFGLADASDDCELLDVQVRP